VIPKPLALIGMLCALACVSCREGSANEKVIAGPPLAGAVYSLADGEGGYRLGKVLAVDEEVIFTKFYADRWTRRPSLAEARKAATPISVAYRPQTFTEMRPVHLENGSVTADELEAFEEWNKGTREIY
jgi:hypothetical protein